MSMCISYMYMYMSMCVCVWVELTRTNHPKILLLSIEKVSLILHPCCPHRHPKVGVCVYVCIYVVFM
jgi:hypothetical protein